jgi:uncharacterized FlaG/YvyC family protein
LYKSHKVSEENSAASDEVSAATQEMSAQAHQVVSSADRLAHMASSLDALVARFRTDAEVVANSSPAMTTRPAAGAGEGLGRRLAA